MFLSEPRCFRQCELIAQSALCALETTLTEAQARPWPKLPEFICDHCSVMDVILLTSFVTARIHLHNSHMRF